MGSAPSSKSPSSSGSHANVVIASSSESARRWLTADRARTGTERRGRPLYDELGSGGRFRHRSRSSVLRRRAPVVGDAHRDGVVAGVVGTGAWNGAVVEVAVGVEIPRVGGDRAVAVGTPSAIRRDSGPARTSKSVDTRGGREVAGGRRDVDVAAPTAERPCSVRRAHADGCAPAVLNVAVAWRICVGGVRRRRRRRRASHSILSRCRSCPKQFRCQARPGASAASGRRKPGDGAGA